MSWNNIIPVDVLVDKDDWLQAGFDFTPYDVTCARCGKVLSCVDAMVEEGDEWECGPCWDRCNAQERQDALNNRR